MRDSIETFMEFKHAPLSLTTWKAGIGSTRTHPSWAGQGLAAFRGRFLVRFDKVSKNIILGDDFGVILGLPLQGFFFDFEAPRNGNMKQSHNGVIKKQGFAEVL